MTCSVLYVSNCLLISVTVSVGWTCYSSPGTAEATVGCVHCAQGCGDVWNNVCDSLFLAWVDENKKRQQHEEFHQKFNFSKVIVCFRLPMLHFSLFLLFQIISKKAFVDTMQSWWRLRPLSRHNKRCNLFSFSVDLAWGVSNIDF